jgi:hypothetical protein
MIEPKDGITHEFLESDSVGGRRKFDTRIQEWLRKPDSVGWSDLTRSDRVCFGWKMSDLGMHQC